MVEYHEHNRRNIWLPDKNAKELLTTADDTEHRIAFGPGLRCKEIFEVTSLGLASTVAPQILRGGLNQHPLTGVRSKMVNNH